ncbi:MAG: hypothetical protein HY364_02965 [Candidatus Aenigmarchaeota archaeon]|nr:hypothetical protein [Candidatus Aenigmarchaeota archaeon]
MALVFQILDVDYFLNGDKPVVRLFGRSDAGNAVCVLCRDFLPYFYIRPKNEEALDDVKEILSIEEAEKLLAIGYSTKKTRLLKITISKPQDVPMIKEQLLSQGIAEEVFEADILFKNRFLVDHDLHGMQWAEADVVKTSTSTVKVPAFEMKSIKPMDRKDNAKLSILSFDIECVPSDPNRPLDSKKDPVVIISLSFNVPYRGTTSIVQVAKPVNGKGLQGFPNEKDMLEGFLRVIDEYNPDIITGYNINTFDIPYILERMRVHGIPPMLGRCKDKPAYNKSTGVTQESIIPGRVVADPYQILKRDPRIKFSRYDLNTICKVLLGDTKMDVEYREMPKLWNGPLEGVLRFAEYARKDAELNLRLVVEKDMLSNFIEIAKVSGTVMQDTFGGQTLRIDNMLLYEFRKRGYVLPAKPDANLMNKRTNEREKAGLKGATVLEPKKGLHAEGCILVMDFKSLYPSIMRTFNTSPDSLLVDDSVGEFYTSPTGAKFVPASVHEGVFPYIVGKLLDSRSEVKGQMKDADGEMKKILNARQYALKDLANSFYGYTGYLRARVYDIRVASTITAIGRENIEKTKDLIENNFDIEVVYGDTDSVFIKTKTTNLEDAKKIGEDISKFVSERLPGFLTLDFEKIYRTFLILTKKRYAGWKFEFGKNGWEDSIEMKGIETVRRDWCKLVSETMRTVLDIILKEGDLQKAVNETKRVIIQLRNNEIDFDKLTVVKGITKSLGSYDGMLPHIELARKLAQRNPHDPPKIGDRLGFVIIKGNQMLSKRAEDTKYAKDNKLQIDSDYYINSQVFPPVERILSSVGVEKSEVFGSGRQSTIADIMFGTKRKMKHEIAINYGTVAGWEGLVCQKCAKSHPRMPLSGRCECGGPLLFSYQGSAAQKVVTE